MRSSASFSRAGSAAAVIAMAPLLVATTGDVFPTEVVDFPRGRVVSFYVWRQSAADDPYHALFLSSMILRLDGRCLSLADPPRDIDAEVNSVSRTFWDVARFENNDYLVISGQGYETSELQAYRVDGTGLKLVLQRDVGGL
jgi:hypothetical protein